MSRSAALCPLLSALALTLPACGGDGDELGAPTTTVVAAPQTETAEVVAPEVEDEDDGDGKGRDKDKPHAKDDGRGRGNAYGHFKQDD